MKPPDLQTTRYELQESLGHGMAAHVWRALDHETGEMVAIKVVNQSSVAQQNNQAQKVLRHFVREVEIMMCIQHPNVAQVYGCGFYEQDGDPVLVVPFMVMEYVQGVSLRARLPAGKPLPLPTVTEVIKGICAGLTAAHAQKVVHRDLKPENVVVGDDPRKCCKLLDFGMAKVVPATFRAKTVSGIYGTPQYMAPERAQGKAVTPAADIYAVGLIAFEMLTGSRPFDDKTAYDVMMRQVYDPAPQMDGVPRAIQAVVMQALDKDPAHRPDAANFALMFEKAVLWQ